jgi:peptidylprolyl isomerase/peptidyl-prolyl cis-trans isomerase B (cyclophilin B)
MQNPFNSQKAVTGIAIALILTAVILGLSGYKLKPANTNSPSNTNSTMSKYTFPGKLSDDRIMNKQARVVTNKGTIVFTLDAKQSPLAVSSFVYLAEQGYFDGLTWHRVVDDFVIQGGDPTGTGTGGPGYQFPDEPVTGEYVEGTVAMANAGPNTNGSQFFICNADDTDKLAKSYSIFGNVTSGLDIVKQITQGDTMTKVTIEPVS